MKGSQRLGPRPPAADNLVIESAHTRHTKGHETPGERVVAAVRQLVRLGSRLLPNTTGINYLPKTKPARKHSGEASKKAALEGTGGKIEDTFVAQAIWTT